MATTSRKRRTRTTRPSVKVADRVARAVIRVGGLGTIAAVCTVFAFLLSVVWPLLRTEGLSPARPLGAQATATRMLATGAEDTGSVAWTFDSVGNFSTLDEATGATLSSGLAVPSAPTAFSFPPRSDRAILGFADGSVRLLRIQPTTQYRDPDAMPPAERQRPRGERFVVEGQVAERVGVDQFALRGVQASAEEPLVLAPGVAIVAVDYSATTNGPAFASVDAQGVLRVTQVTRTQNFMTGEDELSSESSELRLAAVERHGIPRWVLLRGQADNAFVVWEDGHVLRVDVRDLTAPKPVEEVNVLADAGVRVTAVAFLNAKNTLVLGDSTGGLQAWFRTPAPAVEHGDGARMAKAHDLGRGSAAVTALASSARTRLLAVGHQDGSLRVVQVTAAREVASSRLQGGRPVDAVGMTPDDSLLLAWNGGLSASVLDAPHSEVSWRTLFGAVFYEGYSRPEHVWQSSSGSDDFEPKLGLWPLVFGTLKATCYTMLFALPLALMAAVYTSEFLRPETRAVAKPAIEMMASLPSVVLGFLAALVVAPVLERNAAGFLAACVLVPFFVLLAAHAWAFVPRTRRHAWTPLRPLLAALAMAVGILSADVAAPVMEGLLFGGDLHRWLDGKAGGAAGGWMLLLLPASATLVAVVGGRYGRARGAGRSPFASMVAFLGSTAAAVGFAAAASLLLEAGGFDLRGAMFGTYVQRNALVVGCMMAFAVVPVVYTIAEDALASIPANLRAGSLALGATPWQTAVRVVIPTATSGIFSAAMVGLGRAVGETMIVLMAAGNTPVLDWNAFNGFRTLSANIAVELPEAVRGGTHYRTLFLSAFTLFLLTFVLNTAAELVRLRFRKRAAQL